MAEIDRYDYELPRDLIAQRPLHARVDARLLVVDRGSNSFDHKHIRDLPELLEPGDCVVINETRVIAARLVGYRTRTGGRWEGLFLEADDQGPWRVMCKTRGKLVPGETVTLVDSAGQEDIRLTLGSKQPDGTWVVRPETPEPLSEQETFALLERVGHVPLPPYIRQGQMVAADREAYQTVYARTPGAIAAPTAGLHFTERLLGRLKERGIPICRLTLHVGSGTFRPITTDSLAEHEMHSEWGTVGPEAIEQITACRDAGHRAIAIGTTSVRLLETATDQETLRPFTGDTDLFIRPPYEFRAIDGLLTNFHLPKTTLLVLVRTFGGDELIRRAYEEAVRERYRFYSYGDAMLIV